MNSVTLFVARLSFSDVLILNVSDLMFHTTPNTFSFCTSPPSTSLMLMFFCNVPLELILSLQSCYLKTSSSWILQLCRYFLSVELNLLFHQLLWKNSACHQYKDFVSVFLLHQSEILFHYLLRFVFKRKLLQPGDEIPENTCTQISSSSIGFLISPFSEHKNLSQFLWFSVLVK